GPRPYQPTERKLREPGRWPAASVRASPGQSSRPPACATRHRPMAEGARPRADRPVLWRTGFGSLHSSAHTKRLENRNSASSPRPEPSGIAARKHGRIIEQDMFVRVEERRVGAHGLAAFTFPEP